jgi:hypothetical protein
MSFTSLSIIKKHLLSSAFGPTVVQNAEVVLADVTEVELPHHNLVEGSELVKRLADNQPRTDMGIILSGYERVSLSDIRPVKGSIVVTPTETLATIYIEEHDYQSDYIRGQIRRIPGTMIPDNQQVIVYYENYSVFNPDTDYLLDPVRGVLRRREGGAIPDGAIVLVDYTVQAGNVTDELILQALTEADDRIEQTLASGFTLASTDQGLITGETELVLAILARDRAADVLSSRGSSDAAGRAKEWQSLATLYETKAWQTMRPFLDPYAQHSPERTARV